ncbi:MAG: hypothetical protein JWR69_979 [Pedosphaera sp.]|nr:hypothetical protein [Pedosphaera sp.]
MKSLKLIGLLGTFACVLGCNKSSDNTSPTGDTTTNPPRASRQDTNALTPTSRDTNAASRTYGADTNTNAATMSEPDNTAKNVRDRSDAAVTPGDQGGSEADREITRRIRRALTSNDQLSTAAKNIKIITIDGKVTLRGPVNSQQEQQAIAALAQSAGGGTAIDNQLEVKTPNQ